MLVLFPEHILIFYLYRFPTASFEERENIKYTLLSKYNLIPISVYNNDDVEQYISETIIKVEKNKGDMFVDDTLSVKLENRYGLNETFYISDNGVIREKGTDRLFYICASVVMVFAIVILVRDTLFAIF